MNTRLVAVATAGVILLGIGGLFFYNQTKQAPKTPEQTKTEQAKEEPKTLSSLLSLGASQECRFTYEDEETGSTKGVVYVAKNKLRTDLDITDTEGKNSSVSIIRNGDTNYIWGTELETGVKLTLSEEEFKDNEQIKGSLDTEKEVDYDCKGWIVDETKFNPPSNIDFLDLSNLQVTEPKSTGSGSSSQCGSCNSLTGEAKTYCLKQLNCPLE